MKGQSDGISLKSTRKTFNIIEQLLELDGGRVSEVATRLNIPKSTAYAHLNTLHSMGCLVKRGDEYHVGLEFLRIGGQAVAKRTEYWMARDKVKELAARTDERAQFTVEEHGKQILLVEEAGEHAVKTDVHVGHTTHLHTTASGKAILAHLPTERINDIVETIGLPKQTEETICDPDELLEELKTVRNKGFAYNLGERVEKQYAVGVPVFGRNDDLLGALSVAGPAYRMRGERIEKDLPDLLQGMTNELQLNIIYE